MTQFESIKSLIIEGAKASFPSWKQFEYSHDFIGYETSFVFDSVSALKAMRIKELEINNSADTGFRVRWLSAE